MKTNNEILIPIIEELEERNNQIRKNKSEKNVSARKNLYIEMGINIINR
jgi:hypothetical protein